MSKKTNLKFSGFKLRAMFGALVVACCCCVGLFANANASAESTVTSNDVNETTLNQYYTILPSGADKVSGVMIEPDPYDEEPASYEPTKANWCTVKKDQGGWYGYNSPLQFFTYPEMSSGSSFVMTYSSGLTEAEYNADFSLMWMNDSYFSLYSAKFNTISGTCENPYSGSEVYGLDSGKNLWDSDVYSPICSSTRSITHNFGTISSWPFFHLDLKMASAVGVTSDDTSKGTAVISGTQQLTHVYGDGTSNNANLKLGKSDNGDSYTLTINDSHSLTDSTTTTEAKSDVYNIKPASGYALKDIIIKSKTDNTVLGTLDDANTTFNINWCSDIVAEFAEATTITLDPNGGTIIGTSEVSVADGAVSMPLLASNQIATRDGYAFEGYFDAKEGGTQYYSADGTSAHAWDKTADTTLYAHWTKNADPTPTPTPTPDNGSAATDSSASTSTQTGDNLTIYSVLAACVALAGMGIFARNSYRKSQPIRNRKH